MRNLRVVLSLAAVALFASCHSSLDSPPTSDIVGQWSADRVAASPMGSYLHQLTFLNDGRFAAESRSYGIYQGQRTDELSGYSRTVGTFTVSGNRLTFEPDSLISWDSFYGDDSPVTVQAPYPYDSFYDDARYRIEGETLTLEFTTYPADAPEPTNQVLHRDR